MNLKRFLPTVLSLTLSACASAPTTVYTPRTRAPRPPTHAPVQPQRPTETPQTSEPSESTPPDAPLAQALPTETKNVTEKEKSAFRDISALFSKGAYEAATLKAREFEVRYPQSEILPSVQNIQGLIYLFNKQALQAQNQFQKSLRGNKDKRFRHFVLFNSAAAYVETQSFSEAGQALDEISPDTLDPATQVKFYYLRAQVKQKLSASLESVQALFVGSPLLVSPDPEHANPNLKLYAAQLETSLKDINDYSILESVFRQNQSSLIVGHLLVRLAQISLENGRSGLADLHLKKLQSVDPVLAQTAPVKELLARLSQAVPVSGRSVGVLLPLSGKFSRFGTQCRQGIELAFGKSEGLVFEDTGDTVEQAVKALESLVLEKGVVVVIGPLLSKGIEQLTTRAQDLGVPLISLAQQKGATGEYVFRASVTPKQQVQEIARYATEQLGIKKFAIVYPKGKYGQEYADSFWDAVETSSAEVVGVESYPPQETDFRSVVDKLSGLFYPDARYRELGELARKRKEANVTKRTRKTEEFFALKPIVEYEAVFIPDEAKVVSQLVPFFLYRDVDKVKFLGISAWNSPTLTEKLDSSKIEGYFVDTFASDNPLPEFRDFQTRYQQAYETRAGAMEAVAFDAASIVNQILKRSDENLTRSSMRDLLSQVKNFPGSTGKISFSAGEFVRPLKVFSLSKGSINEMKRSGSR